MDENAAASLPQVPSGEWIEAQVDRIVGPTHHFGGLGVGNVASQMHFGQISNPAAAALQGLDKMALVASLGVPQFILPPQPRPRLDFLRSLGFNGDDSEVLGQARQQSPESLSAAMSCSAMWTANAATITPHCDHIQDRNQLQPSTRVAIANLIASLHRSIEPEATCSELRQILPETFRIVTPLPGGTAMRDEGAANHMRLASERGEGVHVFVYGDGVPAPTRYWPRQTLLACHALARLHCLNPEFTFFLKQHPVAIDAGAFHNDVVAMSDHDLLIHHEFAFHTPPETFELLEKKYRERTGRILKRVMVEHASLSIEEAVSTYLFNSQIVCLGNPAVHGREILCPTQVEQNPNASKLVQQWVAQGLFNRVHYVDLGQSMNGGGGPACLRLRIPLRIDELNRLSLHQRWSQRLDAELREAIEATYPTRVTVDDLGRLEFTSRARHARDRIVSILHAG